MSSLYTQDMRGRPLGLPGASNLTNEQRVFRQWVNPNVVVTEPASGAEAATQARLPESAMFDHPRDKMTMDTLIVNYIEGRRATYMAEGWLLFRKGRYREATDKFSLADTVSIDEISERSEVKCAMVLSSLASRQYAVGLNAVNWLLSKDHRTGQIRDARFLEKLPLARTVYPSVTSGELGDYNRHVQEIEQYALRNPDSPDAQIMRAIILWLDKSTRSRALFHAKQIDTPDIEPQWRVLHHLMQRTLDAEKFRESTEVIKPLSSESLDGSELSR